MSSLAIDKKTKGRWNEGRKVIRQKDEKNGGAVPYRHPSLSAGHLFYLFSGPML